MEFNEKQSHIMEVAERLFAEKGFDGASVRDIAEAAGVNLAMISYYFGSKEKLMEKMFQARGIAFREQLQNLLEDETLEPMQKIERLIDDYSERVFNKQSFHKMVVREQMVNNSGMVAEQIFLMKQKSYGLVKQLIEEGQSRGVFRKDVDVSMMMITLTGTISQLVTTQHFYRKMMGMEELSDDEFLNRIKIKLSAHLKKIFKSILTYEG